MRIFLALDEQVERTEDGQASLNQGEKLLVENHKLALPDFSPAGERNLARGKKTAGFHPVNQVTLLHETVADFRLRVTAFHLLQKVSALVRRLDHKFRHMFSSDGP